MRDSSPPTNILVVGSDQAHFQSVLDALPTLAPYWSMTFVDTASEAEAVLMADANLDVVVAAATISDDTGLNFLDRVRAEYPGLARLLLSPSFVPATSNFGTIAHDVLQSPLEPAHVIGVVDTCVTLQRRVSDPALLKLLGEIEMLPSPSHSVLELGRALREPDVDVEDVARIVDSDVAVTAKLLRLVNSAFFGLSNHINSTQQAIAYLGIPAVRNLVGSLELLNSFKTRDADVAFAIEEIHIHSMAVADLARSYLPNKLQAQDAYVAGLLHDVGLLALVACAPLRFLALQEEMALGERSLEACELDVIGTTHTAIGAYVLGLWGFPTWLIETVARSHDADELPEWQLDPTSAVFLAEQAVNLEQGSPSWEGGRRPSDEYLDALGVDFAVREEASSS